jgi:hypothetical protein
LHIHCTQESLGLNKVSKGMDKVFDKVDGTPAPKEEKKEVSLGSKILNSMKVSSL